MDGPFTLYPQPVLFTHVAYDVPHMHATIFVLPGGGGHEANERQTTYSHRRAGHRELVAWTNIYQSHRNTFGINTNVMLLLDAANPKFMQCLVLVLTGDDGTQREGMRSGRIHPCPSNVLLLAKWPRFLSAERECCPFTNFHNHFRQEVQHRFARTAIYSVGRAALA